MKKAVIDPKTGRVTVKEVADAAVPLAAPVSAVEVEVEIAPEPEPDEHFHE